MRTAVMFRRWFGSKVVEQLPALRRYARSLTRNDDAAEDLVQDALLRAYGKQDSFRKDGNLRAWLLSIVHNSFISNQRREAAERRRIDRLAELAETQAPPAQEQAVQLAAIGRAFMALPDEQRAVLHLIAIEGLSYQEASEALGVPVGTIMSRLSRARASLRATEQRSAKPVAEQRLRIVGGRDQHEQ